MFHGELTDVKLDSLRNLATLSSQYGADITVLTSPIHADCSVLCALSENATFVPFASVDAFRGVTKPQILQSHLFNSRGCKDFLMKPVCLGVAPCYRANVVP